MDKSNLKTDTELVALSLQNADYFGELVDRYEKKFSRYIRRLSGLENASIEDVLQESFIKIYTHLNAFDQDLSFSTWAYRITHNETINYLRKNKKVLVVSLENDDEESGQLIDVMKSEIDVAEEISRQDLIDRIRKTINLLPGKYREVLVLRYMEDLEYKAISDILKMPMGTVATMVNRAKGKFKDLAKKYHLKDWQMNHHKLI